MSWLQSLITDFRQLGARARRAGPGTPAEEAFERARADMCATLLQAQRAEAWPGETPRGSLRANLALLVDLQVGGEWHRAVTADLSAGGVGLYLGVEPAEGVEIPFALRLPGGGDPIIGRAHPVGYANGHALPRVALEFTLMDMEDRARVERAVFDAALDEFEASLDQVWLGHSVTPAPM